MPYQSSSVCRTNRYPLRSAIGWKPFPAGLVAHVAIVVDRELFLAAAMTHVRFLRLEDKHATSLVRGCGKLEV
jgi:hypothetical protein